MEWLIFLMLLGSCGACLLAFFVENNANPLKARLGKLVRNEVKAAASEVNYGADLEGPQLPTWLVDLAELGEKLVGKGKSRDKQKSLLLQAGWRQPEALGLLTVIKAGLGVGLALAMMILNGGINFNLGDLALYLGIYFAGGLIPEFILKSQAAKRYTEITRGMPDALDLMVICAEAGLPFTRIIKVVSKELKLNAPILADELAVTNAELQLLPDRGTALRHLAERTMVPTVEGMVATLIQAERYGTPLAQALHNIADESRNTMILTLEEQAGKLPARLSIPLMTMILPPVVALVGAPALMRVIRSLLE